MSTPIPGASDDTLLGRVIDGRYRVDRLIARGGMGRVYAAEQVPLGRTVALKVLVPGGLPETQLQRLQKRFFLEAATYARLTHVNTVTIFDYGRFDDDRGEPKLYMAMEYIDGHPVSRVIRHEGPLAPERALCIAREVARSLSEAHAQGLVHRDLKPSNIMVFPTDAGEAVRVVDFGIVKVLDAELGITRENTIVGTPRYMAPEQIQEGLVDGRTDIYALGVVMYEMLGGKPPFSAVESTGELLAHLHDPPPPLLLRTGVIVPKEVEALVMRCMEKERSRRFETVDALRQAIDDLLPQVEGLPAVPASTRHTPVPTPPPPSELAQVFDETEDRPAPAAARPEAPAATPRTGSRRSTTSTAVAAASGALFGLFLLVVLGFAVVAVVLLVAW